MKSDVTFPGILTVFVLAKLNVAHGRATEERLADGAHGSSAFGCLLLEEPTRHPRVLIGHAI